MKNFFLLAILFTSPGYALDITCPKETYPEMLEELEYIYDKDNQEFHIHIRLPLIWEGAKISKIWVSSGIYDDPVTGEPITSLISVPLGWWPDEDKNYIRSKIILAASSINTYINVDYGVCGPGKSIEIELNKQLNLTSTELVGLRFHATLAQTNQLRSGSLAGR